MANFYTCEERGSAIVVYTVDRYNTKCPACDELASMESERDAETTRVDNLASTVELKDEEIRSLTQDIANLESLIPEGSR